MDVNTIPPADEIEGRTAATTITSFRIVEALQRRAGAGVSELAEELELSKGTVHKHLTTLQSIGYVVKEDGTYRLGLGFLGLGNVVRARMELHRVAHEPLQKLASATGEVASVMVPEHGYGVFLHRISDRLRPELDVHEGERVPLHATAGGKAILAYLPERRREDILDRRGLSQVTRHTTTDRDALATELRDVHDRRIAHDRGELNPDRHCVAAPLTDQNNHAVGAVTVSGPADRMSEKSADSDFPSFVGSTANSIRNRWLSGQ